MPKPNVVFLTAHPDDVAFSAGGTAWLLKKEHQLHVICASKGERGYPDGWRRDGVLRPPSKDIARIRGKEEEASCDLLGASLCWLGLVDQEILPERQVIERVAGILGDLKPVAVFTHGPFEKPDHNAVFTLAYQALYKANRFWETEFCVFHHPQGSHDMHSAPIFVNIDSVVEGKRAQILCHQSHMRTEDTPDEILQRNRHLGAMANCEYAEAFRTPFPMMNRRWGRKAECGRILLDLE